MDVLQSLLIPLTLIVGWVLKNRVPNDKLQNDVIPYLLFGGNLLLGIVGEVSPAAASFGITAISFGFLGPLFAAAVNAFANTGQAMLFHALLKKGKRVAFDPLRR